MRQAYNFIAIVAVATLGACTASGPTAPGSTPPNPAAPGPTASAADACGASAAQHAVGTTPAEAEPILREVSEAAGGTYRIVEYGQPITMEFRADRLTARVGRNGRIESVSCG